LGFTTLGEEARSSRYASDVAKINGSPVLRVNAEVCFSFVVVDDDVVVVVTVCLMF
jgi:2-oxoglutarate dehydrogenase complex dehydrogenase (E1) component-like enzyme